MTALRIGVLATSYPRRAGDPAGSFVEAHVHALRALGHTVDVVAAGDATTTPAPHVTRIPGGGLFYRGGAPDTLERAPLRSLAPAAAFGLRFAAAARRHRWDTVIAHWLVPPGLVAAALARPQLPALAIAHGGDLYTLRRLHLLAPALHALHHRGVQLAFVGEHLREVARAAAPRLAAWLDTALVQPMGLDLARFAALDRAPRSPPMILVAARLVPIKGIDVALAAFAQLRTRAQLVIAGDGPLPATLRATPGVQLLGEVDTHRRDQLLREASVVVVPSRRTPHGRTEGTPLIALEALAAGVPVIASAVGGLAALPQAHLVPPDEPRALAAAIDASLAAAPPDPAALRRAVADLDWSRVAERLLRRK